MDTVIVTREYLDKLIEDSEFLARLQSAGVDSWDGYHLGFRDEEDEDSDD